MRAPWSVACCLVALLGCPGKDSSGVRSPDDGKPSAAAGAASLEPRIGGPVAAGSLRTAEVVAPYGIIVPNGGDANAIAARVEAALKARGYALDLDTPKPGKRVAGVAIGTLPEANVHVEALQFVGRGLSATDVEGITAATQAVAFVTIGPAGEITRIQHDGAAIAREVAADGWIVDSVTGEVFSRAELTHVRPEGFPIDARRLMVVHVVRDGDGPGVFLETFGLARFGVPELFIRQVPNAFADEMHQIVNAAAQSLVERGSVTADGELTVDLASLTTAPWKDYAKAIHENGGSGKVTFRATWSKGDGEDAVLIELTLPSGGDAEKMHAAATAFLGRVVGASAPAPENDPELLAASARAKKELAEIAKRCAKGIPELETLGIKAPFETSGGTEFMWVEVQACKGDRFTGVLLNQPNGDSPLVPGSKVEVKLQDAFDYLYRFADGTTKGDETSKIVMKRRGG
jgi:uncharacterized protein YegJ (DUF2314 family)